MTLESLCKVCTALAATTETMNHVINDMREQIAAYKANAVTAAAELKRTQLSRARGSEQETFDQGLQQRAALGNEGVESQDQATALETLQRENARLRGELEKLKQPGPSSQPPTACQVLAGAPNEGPRTLSTPSTPAPATSVKVWLGENDLSAIEGVVYGPGDLISRVAFPDDVAERLVFKSITHAVLHFRGSIRYNWKRYINSTACFGCKQEKQSQVPKFVLSEQTGSHIACQGCTIRGELCMFVEDGCILVRALAPAFRKGKPGDAAFWTSEGSKVSKRAWDAGQSSSASPPAAKRRVVVEDDSDDEYWAKREDGGRRGGVLAENHD